MCGTDSSVRAILPNRNPVPHNEPAAASATYARVFTRSTVSGSEGLFRRGSSGVVWRLQFLRGDNHPRTRKTHDEPRAALGSIADGDRSPVHMDDVVRDGQAKPEAA